MEAYQTRILIYTDCSKSVAIYKKNAKSLSAKSDIILSNEKSFSDLINENYALLLLDGSHEFIYECLNCLNNIDAKVSPLTSIIVCTEYCERIKNLIQMIKTPNIDFVIKPCPVEYILNKLSFHSSYKNTKLEEAYKELNLLKRKLEMREKGIKKTDEAIKILYGEILKSNEIAENAIKCKSDFLTNMSHEIRTPLNAITGMIHLAIQLDLPPKLSGYLKKIDNAGKLLLNIVNDILDFSKIEAGKLNIESVGFDLNEIFENLSNVIMCKASEKKDLVVSFNIEPGIEPCLIGDPLRIEQVLVNLANNAIKFTDSGSIDINAKILDENNENIRILFSVEDTGIGITDEQQEKLFDAFVQADSSTTRKYGGTGLGLSICKQLVELMGGKISIKSKYGVGSNFMFELTLQKQLVKNDSSEVILDTLDSIEGAEILLVEDNFINQEIAVSILEANNLNVTVANNGSEALDAVQSKSFDIIFMDVQMPVMDGLEATQFIRKNKSKNISSIPIIGMTAHAFASHKEECLSKGMNDYLTKPIQICALNKILLKWVPEKKTDIRTKNRKLSKINKNIVADFKITHIPGIDILSGINRIGGNKELYISLLSKCVHEYADIKSKLDEAVNYNGFDRIESIAHSIAGVSGNLGAMELSASALSLERAFGNSDKDVINDKLECFYKNLDRILKEIKVFLENHGYNKDNYSIQKERLHGNLNFLLNQLTELEKYLSKRIPKPCKNIVKEIDVYKWTDSLEEDLKKLVEYITRYKFKDAEPVINNLIAAVKKEIEMEKKYD